MDIIVAEERERGTLSEEQAREDGGADHGRSASPIGEPYVFLGRGVGDLWAL